MTSDTDHEPEWQALHNIEAEQGVLGAIILYNGTVELPAIKPFHFHDPLHARIFDVAMGMIDTGKLVSPVTLKGRFDLSEVGGDAYLVRMAGVANRTSAFDMAKLIMDLWARRDIADAAQAAQESVTGGAGAVEVAATLETRLTANREQGGGPPRANTFGVGLVKALESISEAYSSDDGGGISHNLAALTDIIGNLRPGRTYVLAGRPSMGKTLIALNIARHVARTHGVIFASLEMNQVDLVNRILSMENHERGLTLPYSDMERGQMTEAQYRATHDAAREIIDLPIMTIEREHRDLTALMSAIRGAHKKLIKPGLIIIDYLQLVEMDDAKSDYQRVSRVSEACKSLAIKLDIPVLALSQLSRNIEKRDNKRPILSDLRESGRIEEDADVVMFAYRHAYYLEREIEGEKDPSKKADAMFALEKVHDRLEIIVSKQRAGRIGTAYIRCNPAVNLVFDTPKQEDLSL